MDAEFLTKWRQCCFEGSFLNWNGLVQGRNANALKSLSNIF